MKLGYPRHGLRVTVRLHGTVVEQHVLWAPPVRDLLALASAATLAALLLDQLVRADVTLLHLWTPVVSQLAIVLLFPTAAVLGLVALAWPRAVEIGGEGLDAVPGPEGGPLARVRWAPGRDPELVDLTAGQALRPMGAAGAWRWSGEGVEVDVQGQAREAARRLPTDPLGDLGLVVVALSLYVAVLQARAFVETMPGPAGPSNGRYEMSPELIARLLQRDFEGADEGVEVKAERPELDQQAQGPFLPAGNHGVMTRAGGGARQGDQVLRSDELEEEQEEVLARRDEQGEDALELEATPEARPDALAEVAGGEQPQPEELQAQDEALASRPRDPMERFIGWGFRDWMDASERQLAPEVQRQLLVARERLRLDPDDPGALQTVGHYAYLAEQTELGRSAFQRLIEVDPGWAGAYNNLALTYKRTGEYETEEALYRKALEIDPLDPIVLNNLAVSLAHQERYDEALAVMSLLDELDPDDPYSDLHRAKVYAAMGKTDRAFRYLKKALAGVQELDSLHHVEFRQDLRLEPLFAKMRREPRFERMIRETYGREADAVLRGGSRG